MAFCVTESINELINDEGDCRAAPATPGLLIIEQKLVQHCETHTEAQSYKAS